MTQHQTWKKEPVLLDLNMEISFVDIRSLCEGHDTSHCINYQHVTMFREKKKKINFLRLFRVSQSNVFYLFFMFPVVSCQCSSSVNKEVRHQSVRRACVCARPPCWYFRLSDNYPITLTVASFTKIFPIHHIGVLYEVKPGLLLLKSSRVHHIVTDCRKLGVTTL